MSSDDHDLDAAEAQTTTALRTYMTSEGGDDYAAITDFVEPVVDLYADQPVELGKVGDTVRSLWELIIDTAETTPYYDASQDRLVDFVRRSSICHLQQIRCHNSTTRHCGLNYLCSDRACVTDGTMTQECIGTCFLNLRLANADAETPIDTSSQW
jgi:hypothetical protein